MARSVLRAGRARGVVCPAEVAGRAISDTGARRLRAAALRSTRAGGWRARKHKISKQLFSVGRGSGRCGGGARVGGGCGYAPVRQDI